MTSRTSAGIQKSIYNQNGNAVTNNFIIGGDAQIAHAESQGVCGKGVFLRTQSSHSNNGRPSALCNRAVANSITRPIILAVKPVVHLR